jgi:hypothetical protein
MYTHMNKWINNKSISASHFTQSNNITLQIQLTILEDANPRVWIEVLSSMPGVLKLYFEESHRPVKHYLNMPIPGLSNAPGHPQGHQKVWIALLSFTGF